MFVTCWVVECTVSAKKSRKILMTPMMNGMSWPVVAISYIPLTEFQCNVTSIAITAQARQLILTRNNTLVDTMSLYVYQYLLRLMHCSEIVIKFLIITHFRMRSKTAGIFSGSAGCWGRFLRRRKLRRGG